MKQKISILFFIGMFFFVIRINAQGKVKLDNAKVKITEYISQPGQDVCGPGKHTHKDHVTILLTDAYVKKTNENGSVENETYSAAQHQYIVNRNGKTEKFTTDGTFWATGETHTVINTGKSPIRLLIVEVKE
ncbi:MAG: hypothetical protein QM731_08490 [Chitinophagaceae bacterium]